MERAKSKYYVDKQGELTCNPNLWAVGIIETDGELQFRLLQKGFDHV